MKGKRFMLTNAGFDKYQGAGMFVKRFLKNPRQLGAVFPSSNSLGSFIAEHVDAKGNSPILELGGGTGSLTKAMLNCGVAPERLYIIELDPELCAYLKGKFPQCHVVHGCATKLEDLLPKEVIGQIHTTVSGLPLLNMPKEVRKNIMRSCFNIMGKHSSVLQYTYSPKASLAAEEYGLQKEKLGMVLRNVPPATIWRYWQ